MSRSPKTDAEKAYHMVVAAMGCIVCRNLGHGWVPNIVHHTNIDKGTGQRSGHGLVLPLCPEHHKEGPPGVAVHSSLERFEMIYGSEEQLLNQHIIDLVQELLFGGHRPN